MKTETTGLGTYFSEISRHRVPTRQEEYALFERLHSGDPSAREEIIQSNLRLVVRIAQRFQGKGLSLEDLIQEGNIGLMDVVNRFDHTLGYRFSTYAAFWIRQAIQVAIRKQSSLIRLPVRKMRQLGRISDMVQEYQSVQGRRPTREELARRLCIKPAAVDELLNWAHASLSLDMPLDENGDTLKEHLPDTLSPSPFQESMNRERREKVRTALAELTDRECSILQLRFGMTGRKSRSLRHISRDVGLSQEGVRRVEKRALAKLHRPHMARRLVGLL